MNWSLGMLSSRNLHNFRVAMLQKEGGRGKKKERGQSTKMKEKWK